METCNNYCLILYIYVHEHVKFYISGFGMFELEVFFIFLG